MKRLYLHVIRHPLPANQDMYRCGEAIVVSEQGNYESLIIINHQTVLSNEWEWLTLLGAV